MKINTPSIKNQFSLIGQYFFDYAPLNKQEKINEIKNIKDFINGKIPSYVNTNNFYENGKEKSIKRMFQPVYNEHKKVDQINILGIDVTQEEIARKKLVKALKAKDEAFINASHEFRTPLNLIFSSLQLTEFQIQRGFDESLKNNIIKNNKIIKNNSYRLTKLINNILDITKLEHDSQKLNLSRFDIVYVIDDIIESVSSHCKQMNLNIVFDTEIDEYLVVLDLYKFERILLNLISNAFKFSNNGDTIYINLIDNKENIEISVKDQGIGIDSESLDHIFDKFFQVDKTLNRNSEGTGLGLSLVKFLVELHKGKIEVESVIDKGTTFTILFPKSLKEDKNIKDFISVNRNLFETVSIELSDLE